jgi:hypothetical protein
MRRADRALRALIVLAPEKRTTAPQKAQALHRERKSRENPLTCLSLMHCRGDRGFRRLCAAITSGFARRLCRLARALSPSHHQFRQMARIKAFAPEQGPRSPFAPRPASRRMRLLVAAVYVRRIRGSGGVVISHEGLRGYGKLSDSVFKPILAQKELANVAPPHPYRLPRNRLSRLPDS